MNYSASDLLFVSPIAVLTLGALLVLLYEVLVKRPWSRGAFTSIVFFSAFFVNLYIYVSGYFPPTGVVFNGQLYVDSLSGFINGLILLAAAITALISIGQLENEKVEATAEYYALMLMSVIGAIIFASAAEFITLFIGLEIMSMALYCLCGASISQRGSAESALKYFLLGSFSSAFLLYGIALVYGLSGSMEFSAVAQVISAGDTAILSVAAGLILVGLLFKIAAVPFHFWAPDVYQGAPTSVTIFMASVIKISAAVVTLRVLWIVFPGNSDLWMGAVWTIAVITMTVGNLTALRQRSLKRMLAYSSIAHAGYMLVAMLVGSPEFDGGTAVIYYLIAYCAMTIGAFAVVLVVASPYIGSGHPDDISRFNSLGRRHPMLAAVMSLFMFSLAGLPPGMAGLLAKFFVFSSAIKAGLVGIAIIGMLNSAVSVYYYLRVIVAMYFLTEKKGEQYSPPNFSVPAYTALGACAVAVVLLGCFPFKVFNEVKKTLDPVLNNTVRTAMHR